MCGVFTRQFFQRALIRSRGHVFVVGVRRRLFLGEIRGRVFFLCVDLRVGLHVRIGLRGLAVFLVRKPPEFARDGVAVVFERQGAGNARRLTVLRVRIIELRAADPHGHVGGASTRLDRTHERPLAADDHGDPLVVHGITHEVGRRIELAQVRLRALHFVLHGRKQHVGLVVRRRRCQGRYAADTHEENGGKPASERAEPGQIHHKEAETPAVKERVSLADWGERPW